MERVVVDELLDLLPHEHPDALASRRDIQRLNRVTGTDRWWCRTLLPLLRPGDCALELGAGGGELLRRLRRAMPGVAFDGLDVCPQPVEWPVGARWHRESALEFDGYAQYPVVFANFLLHQFTDDGLRALGERLQGARVLVFSELVRRRRHQWMLQCARLLNVNHVTRHDGHVSIAAGFRANELARLLGLDRDRWQVSWEESWIGIYRLVAQRLTRA